jgi:hypothetical protein
VAGLAAAGLATMARDVSPPRRILLGLLGAAALTIAVIDHTAGLPMVVWFLD